MTARLSLSAKGIVLRRYSDGGFRVLLCRNDRAEWELPGGRLAPGESEVDAVAREVTEETGQQIWVGPLVSRFVLPIPSVGAAVEVAAYGCHLAARRPLRLSPEHRQLAWLPVAELPESVPAGYAAAVAEWARSQE